MRTEIWLSVVGYEGAYEVSDRGRLRSVDRDICSFDGVIRRIRGGMLSPRANSVGRMQVNLYAGSHRLVLLAHGGPCPDGMECCHNNGDPLDNRIENLRWDTKGRNYLDSVRHGTNPRGERHPGAKLTEGLIRSEIIPALDRGEEHLEIANRCGVKRSAISKVACGRTWGWVTGRTYTRQAVRDVCANGHKLEGGNLRLTPGGDPACRRCSREAKDRWMGR